MTRTAKTALTATAAALLAAGVTITTGASGWALPAWLQDKAPSSAPATGGAPPSPTPTPTPVAAAAAAVAAQPAVALPPAQLPNYRAIVQTQGPAVVGINVAGLHKASAEENAEMQGLENDPFFRFFRGVPGMRMQPRGPQPFRGQGSGFIISSDGLVLTNAHVVRDAKQVTVKLSDRREFQAQVLGSDPATDIAVLKLDANGLPTVQLGDPRQVQVGDYVLAIGAPYGFEQTATQGIVSAKGRSLPGDSVVPFIQTDAAVNPGNSGGPLFDASGRVVGVNAQIFSQSGGFQGLAFSIPIDVALKIKDQLVAHGKVEHARLGVTLQDLSAPLAASFGLNAPDGALVSSVQPSSAAAKAGLKAGDVITAVDGEPVRVAGDVSSRVGLAQPGDKLKLEIWRDKARVSETVALGRADKDVQDASAAPQGGQLGLALRPLERQELRGSGLDHGLLIERVTGPAQLAGVQPGDVLLALNGKPVQDIDAVRAAMKDAPKQVALLVSRGGQQIFVPVRLG
ncbi:MULTISPECIES: Do family serine endopeptidase [unclassified Roseateles]|uniref:Do family serine endopeptidase n=1 Tax=unclassified Roseateles TaxID=2626991 RepID=UPI0006FA7AD2|nr:MULTISPECIES: Do family serine endopeptidase [unclassified Roseateles]KQW46318.1 peptidase [Pelomonas sp. Root405]KRA73367.1 peptidase [Pelomonas sp. Root662]